MFLLEIWTLFSCLCLCNSCTAGDEMCGKGEGDSCSSRYYLVMIMEMVVTLAVWLLVIMVIVMFVIL